MRAVVIHENTISTCQLQSPGQVAGDSTGPSQKKSPHWIGHRASSTGQSAGQLRQSSSSVQIASPHDGSARHEP
jgi:hypothetical protein